MTSPMGGITMVTSIEYLELKNISCKVAVLTTSVSLFSSLWKNLIPRLCPELYKLKSFRKCSSQPTKHSEKLQSAHESAHAVFDLRQNEFMNISEFI